MSTREERGPKGEIELYYQNEESASNHRDITSRATLRVPEGRDHTLALTLDDRDGNAIKQKIHTNREEYSISVDELIALIKEYGKRYH